MIHLYTHTHTRNDSEIKYAQENKQLIFPAFFV